MIKKLLQQIAIILQLGRTFFPSILLISIVYVFFTDFVQGKDIILTGLQSKQTGLFFLITLHFWVLITWYTSRLIAYNHDRLFSVAKKGLYHAPRLLGYLCFSVIFISLISLEPTYDNAFTHSIIFVIHLIAYVLLHKAFEKINHVSKRNILLNIRIFVWIVFIASIAWMTYSNKLNTYISFLPMLQTGYLYLVITRRKISGLGKQNIFPTYFNLQSTENKYKKLITWIFTDPTSSKEKFNKELTMQTEKNIFLLFVLFSLIAIFIYFNIIFDISFARFVSPLPIILISFAVLLGAGNILSLLSIKLQINFHFIFLAALVIIGYFVETHNVRIVSTEQTIDYKSRPLLRKKFIDWLENRKQELNHVDQNEFPIYLVLADGGASRSAYWTASVLSELEEKSKAKFSKNLFCLSGASGGSLGNIVFYGSMHEKLKDRLNKIQSYLSNDFLSFPLARLLGPDLVVPFIPGLQSTDRASALEKSMEYTNKTDSISSFMRKDLSAILYSKNKTFDPVVAINTTRMQDGTPGLISNIQFDNEISGKRIDIIGQLNGNESMSLSTAVVLGARFPYFSPAGRIRDQYFVDGGYFDNSGGGIVYEMILDLNDMIADSLKINPNHSFKKIRFHVIHISNQADNKNKIRKTHPLVNDLAAPIKTIMGSYASQTDFNNLRLYKYLLELYKGDTTYHTINLYGKGEIDNFPMNWSISQQSLEKMNDRLKNHEKLKELAMRMARY